MRGLYARIRSMFYYDAMPPSMIDKALMLVKGTAHDVIVSYWMWEHNENALDV